ncbi:LLM class flavin-dependent oxidoreductase [Streptomyces sp. NBC_00481]|uniref:LLM class flavin-dependent oxidoreductase n=1 Tax=unclassified Streptomyces TaxID=2593676 RepID=UPI002DDC3264|nr:MULTISPECIES: LLM class flavin-dependent oxidoreductase [unclassified Streptomyces]WRZ00397.1 LLM class flavin-dependent oxidoreductase [Streptomyces sp. NBC_00481]
MTPPEPFRFAVVAELTYPPDHWRDLVRRCETLGYDALYVTDHAHQRLSPIPALTAAATLGDRLRLGTYVLNNDLRDPALVTRDLLTLHALSGHRAILGLGAGWLPADYRDTRLPLEPGPLRYERLRTALDTVRAVLAAADHAPPLLVGGARRRILTLAGQQADIVSIVPPLGPTGPLDPADGLPERVDARMNWVREGAVGRPRPPLLNHLVWACLVTEDPSPVRAALAAHLGHSLKDVARMVPYLIGTVDEVAEALLARRERWGFSLVTVPEAAVETFVPVMSLLRGR